MLPAAVDDQAAVVKSVETDPRPAAAAGEAGELGRRPIIEPGEFQDGASDRQRELGADPQPDVLVRGAPDADSGRGQADSGLERSLAKLGDDPLDACGQRSLGNPFAAGSAVNSMPGESIMRPMPPNCRATSGPHPRRPKCKRLGVRTWRRWLIMTGAGSGPVEDHDARPRREHGGARA